LSKSLFTFWCNTQKNEGDISDKGYAYSRFLALPCFLSHISMAEKLPSGLNGMWQKHWS
jgi:hypothetical protein